MITSPSLYGKATEYYDNILLKHLLANHPLGTYTVENALRSAHILLIESRRVVKPLVEHVEYVTKFVMTVLSGV